MTINYLVENDPRDCRLLQLLPSSLNLPFLVINGDVLTRLNPSSTIKLSS